MDKKTETNIVYLTNDFDNFTKPSLNDDFYGWVNYNWFKYPSPEIRLNFCVGLGSDPIIEKTNDA